MSKIDLNDKELFGNDAGEDEIPHVLESYFIELDDFYDFNSLDENLCVVSARKGMGKSALLNKFAYSLKESERNGNVIVVRTTGNALLGMGSFHGNDPAFLENYWKQIICKKINIEIGKKIGLAFSNDEISMVEAAELEGIKNKNIVGALLSRIKGKIPTLNIELKTQFPDNWEARLTQYQANHEQSTVWLLVDDIDSKYIDNVEYQNRIGSFFTAIRGLANEVKNLKIRSTVRSDVWSNLRHLEDLDKWEQYIIEINWTNRHLRDMLAKRISSYIKRKHASSKWCEFNYKTEPHKLFNLIFTKRITWGKESRESFEPIRILSNGRPRWMGQLCRMAAKHAYKTRSRFVGINQINEIMKQFGRYRKNDLIKEHRHQFNDLDKLIDAFRAKYREYDIEEANKVIQDYVSNKESENIPTIDGEIYNSPVQLGAFLYKIGFISNISDGGIEFINYPQDPDLYKSTRNLKKELKWAIHPSYRKYLNIK